MLVKGDVLEDRYIIQERVGSGGYGTVYRANDRKAKRIVAIKVLRSDLADDPDYRRRFRREADIARVLQSEHVVKVLGSGSTGFRGEDVHYLVMEFVDGETLQERLRRGRLSVKESLRLAWQVAGALEEAEARGIIHRDIKPKNIFLGEQGVAQLGDFGIAKATDYPSLQTDDPILGTPRYMSPEQCLGTSDESSVRSDIYSLGVVLYEMLCGRPPFEGDSPNVIAYKHVNERVRPLKELAKNVPVEVDSLVQRCLQKRPEDRFQHASELQAAIGSLIEGRTSADDTPVTPIGPLTKRRRRLIRVPRMLRGRRIRELRLPLAVGGLVFLFLGFGVIWAANNDSGDTAASAPTTTQSASVATGSDADGDGVADSIDQCDAEPETANGYFDLDGCPDVALSFGTSDTDDDGIPDSNDACDSEDETMNGYLDADGCPDVLPPPNIPDSDGDRIPDVSDECDFEVETINGYIDADGCPDVPRPPTATDADGDGIPDSEDACDNQDETVNGYQDSDGCPDTSPNPDPDGDGYPNSIDTCDNEPETFNGYQDNDGCPDSVPVPNAPSNLAVTPLDPYTLELVWTDNSNNEDGFEIADCVPPLNSSGCVIDQLVGADVVSYVVGDLSPGSYKCFSMRSFNAYAFSNWSPQYVCTTTPTSPVRATMISPIPGSTLSSTSVTFSWTAGTRVTLYGLWVGTSSAPFAAATAYADSGGLSATSYSVSGLPLDGSTIYVELWSFIDGAWQGEYYTYVAGG